MKWDSKVRKTGKVIVLDNGGHSAKVGTNVSAKPEVLPNCIMKVKSERRRAFICDQIEDCGDLSGLFYILPMQKGYIVNWDVQKMVWDYIFSKNFLSGKLSEIPLLITEPCFNFQSVQEAMDEIIFEEYECCGALRLPTVDLSAYKYTRERGKTASCVVVESGYSFSHIVPYINGEKYLPGVRRIDVGGKLLTNHLKEVISYRQLNVMDETHVVNQIKEAACFVSDNFNCSMKEASYRDHRNKIARDYVLPDYSTVKNGYLKKLKYRKSDEGGVNPKDEEMDEEMSGIPEDEQQIITMNNERFTIPELLYMPSDVGINQMGLSEAFMDCMKSCPANYPSILLKNIVVTGGCASFDRFSSRLYSDIRKEVEDILDVKYYTPKNPVTYCWEGGKLLSNSEYYFNLIVTREDYMEYGPNICHDRFSKFNLKGQEQMERKKSKRRKKSLRID